MVEVGKLVDGVLSVRHKGKWRRKLCVLEKQATFSNCLKLFVFDEDGSNCRFQDVVHAFISFLDPNRQGTLMLVCNYKVRCISFDQFDVLNKWVEVLHAHLVSNYFHADLLVASQGSRLAKYAARRPWPRFLSQKRGSQSGCSSGPRARYGLSDAVSGDGYLHVTRDRICFTTGPSCPRPRLLATWNFDNDEIVQCGTARLYPSDMTGLRTDSGGDYLEADATPGPASLFFLTAFPDHPEAPGSYLFLSDRATELCQWIEHNNRSAVDQAEWRRLTSMAAVLESPSPTPEPNLGMRSPWDQSGLFPGQVTDWTLYSNKALLSNASSCPCSAPCFGAQNESFSYPSMNNLNHCSEKLNSLKPNQSNQDVLPVSGFSVASTSHSPYITHEQLEPEPDVQNTVNMPTDEISTTALPKSVSYRPDSDAPLSDASSVRMSDFHRRKLAAMHSRHRFSSHPVAGAGGYLGTNRECKPDGVRDSWSPPDSQPDSMSMAPTGSFRPSLSYQDSRWRQSEPQLVTLSPIPIPVTELQDYLKRHSKGRTTCHFQSCIDSQPNICPGDSQKQPQCMTCKPVSTNASGISPRHHTHPSECSVVSTSDSTTSSEPQVSASHCQVHCASTDEISPVSPASTAVLSCPASASVSTAPASNISHRHGICSGMNWFTGRRRRRLPSSWSTTTSLTATTAAGLGGTKSGSEPDKTDLSSMVTTTLYGRFSTASRHFHFLNRSLSNGTSPKCNISPLHPTCTVVPGSQYFVPRRRHTASASEAFSIRSGFSSAGPSPNAVCTLVAPNSTKTSLISLAASAIPLWAEAPTQAKPRTGCNYVSRESVAALHAQRKQQHQQSHQHPPPPPPPPRPIPSSSSYVSPTCCSGSYTSDSTAAPLVHPHPCTPVPEAPRESDDVMCKSTERCATCNTSRTYPAPPSDPDKLFPSTGSLEPHIRVGLHAPPTLKLPTSDSLNGKGSGVAVADPSTTTTEIDCRSYINVAPTSHRSIGLQPIDEGLFSHSGSTCNLTQQPIFRRVFTHIDAKSTELKESGGCLGTTSGGLNDLNANIEGSYVNISACTLSNGGNRNGHTASNSSLCTLPAQYINLVSPTLRSEARGGHCAMNSPACITQPLCHPKMIETHETIASAGQIYPKPTNKNSRGLLVSSSSAHLCPLNVPSVPISCIDHYHQPFNGPVRTSAPSQKLQLPWGDGGPRLNYADLALSPDSADRNVRSPASTTATTPSSNGQNSQLTQLPNHRRPSLQTVQSLPYTFAPVNSSIASQNVTTTPSNPEDAASSDVPSSSSGLNYVTIDLVQTKALSELEQELRGATELDTGLQPSISRRINLSRVLANSATLPGSSTHTFEPFNRTRCLERASSHCGGANGSSNGKSDGFGVSFPTRMLSRLVQSLTFNNNHNHNNISTQSTGIERIEKQGGSRKRLGRPSGPSSSSKEPSSTTTAATSRN